MITARAWAGKRYGVLGLARSGAATVRALVASGAQVVAWDENEQSRQSLWEQLKQDRQELGTGPGLVVKNWLLATDLSGYEAIVVSPGVPLNRHPVAEKAARYDLPIIGDIELFALARAELPPHRVVGITGTNGKSTTTALVHHILQTAGVPSLMGGNIGLPILAQEPLLAGGVYVLELSSYQIDLTFTLDCDVAVLTNITPDHLDRYDGFEAYTASKARLFTMQSGSNQGEAVFSGADQTTSGLCNTTNKARLGRVLWVDNSFEELLGVSVFEGEASIYGQHVGYQQDWPALQGPHNAENAGAAIATCHLLGLALPVISDGLRTFPGLPHRMERIGEVADVAYVNDSKATNPESAAPALAAFERVHWIVGGRAKGDGLDACRPGFPHVVRAYTIGEAGPGFAAWLRPHLSVAECGTLEVAVNAASSAAQPGETVLLSPAAASFDQFRDFEARGDAFRGYVEALA